MPCFDGSRDCVETIYVQSGPKIDHLTHLLCAACQQLDGAGLALPAEVRAFWDAHKKADAEREEARRKHALEERAHKEAEEFYRRKRVELGLK